MNIEKHDTTEMRGYQAAIYQIAIAQYMGETEAKMIQLLATVAGEFNVPMDKVQRDVGIKSRNFEVLV